MKHGQNLIIIIIEIAVEKKQQWHGEREDDQSNIETCFLT
jgi:hypothetical protein